MNASTIMRAHAVAHGVSLDALRSGKRSRPCVRARAACARVLREQRRLGVYAIARLLHCSVWTVYYYLDDGYAQRKRMRALSRWRRARGGA